VADAIVAVEQENRIIIEPMADHKKTILVVEDDPGMSKAIGRLLRVADFQAMLFSSAEEFLETDSIECADCLIFDIHLPGMSGLELRDRLVSSGYDVPVIFITAHDEPSTRAEAESLGCSAYFRKPFDGETFLRAVKLAADQKAKQH
jgi:FixJ family two-component response regulator